MFPVPSVKFRREVRVGPSLSNLSHQVYPSEPTQPRVSSDDAGSAGPASVSTDFQPPDPNARLGFAADFRRFFLRGLAAIMPTLITLWVIVWAWNFLWSNVGIHIVLGIRWVWMTASNHGILPYKPAAAIYHKLADEYLGTRLLGVLLSILLVYIVGVFVGNLIGRTAWRLAEHGVMKIPLLRAIYPAVKQITDFVLSERTDQFQHSAVVAVEPHQKGIWSIGLVTGSGVPQLSAATGQEMVTVFVPSSPTAFSGYVLVVPKSTVIELPIKVEEAMRLLVSGGVLTPGTSPNDPAAAAPGDAGPSGQPRLKFRSSADAAPTGFFLYNPPAQVAETKEQKT
jgi:uncharacterized membrane protein